MRQRVAATDVKMVEEEQCVEARDGLSHPMIPVLVAGLLASQLAELLVVGLVFSERVVGQLDMGQQVAVHEEGGPESGAQGNDEFESFSDDDRQSLHVGVVGHPSRHLEAGGQGRGQIEVGPRLGQVMIDRRARALFGHEMRHAQHMAPTHHPGKSTRRPIGLWERFDQRGERGHQAAVPVGGHWVGTWRS